MGTVKFEAATQRVVPQIISCFRVLESERATHRRKGLQSLLLLNHPTPEYRRKCTSSFMTSRPQIRVSGI
jgi:hypothetical protein